MVIEDLVSRIMVPYLQQYVDNFDKKNLNIAVLKGVASLKDVKLKEYALDNISDTIPFYISFSHISLLEFDVPYTSLNAKSVVCSLKDVYIVLRPKMKRPYNQEEEKQRQRELKKHLLDQFEKQQLEKEKQKDNPEKTEEGFFDKLIETVLNNLKIKLENIHIQYQDDDNCVAGFSLESMEVNSTDSNFEKKFQKNLGELTYKLLTMQKLAIYLNPWTEEEKVVNNCIQNRMSDQEIIQKINAIQNRVYLLKPVDGCLKLTMQKLSASGIDLNKPQFNAVFEFMNDIQMCLSQNQYNSIFKIVEYLTNYSVQSQYRHFRPNNFDPLAYWKYAINCVTHQKRQERMSKIYEQTVADTCREYVRVYKIIVKVPWVQHKATPNDVHIFKKIEEERSIQEILYFRKCAHKEINQEAKNFEENKKRKSSWFSAEKLQEKAIELSDKVKEELYKSIGFEESAPVVVPDDYVKVQVHVDLAKLSFLVYHEKSDLMELVVDRFVSDIQVLPHKAFRVCASMGNFTLYDRFSGTLYPEFITKSKRWSEAASSNLLSMFLERRSPIEKKENESDINFSLNLDQIDIVVNFEFFQRILSFLYFDSVNIKRLEKEAKRQIKKVSKMAKKEIKEVLMQDDTTVDLSLNIKAPQLIIPWSVSDPNTRFLLVDFGMFTLKKDTSVPLREKFDINMENMEIIVPFDINAVGYLSNEQHIGKYDVILEKASFSASAMKYKSDTAEEKVQVIVNVPCINFVLSKESMLAVAVLTQQIAEFKQNPTGTKQKINDLKIMGSLMVNHDDSGFAPFFVEVSSTKKIFFYSDESKKYLKIIAHLNSHSKVWKSDKYENTFCLMLPQKKGYQTKYIYLQCSSEDEMEKWVTTLTMFIYSFNTHFFVDDFADILKEVSFSDDEEEEEEQKEGVLIAIRFNLSSFILSLSHHDVNLASVYFSNLQAYFRQYHNLDSNLSLHLHAINVKSEVIKDREFYLIKSIDSQSDQDEKEHLVNVNFTRSVDPTSPIYDPSSQMKLNVTFKSLHCFVEPAILSSFIDYGYDLQDILDQITAFNKINYYSFVPDEDEKDAGQKFSDLARMLLEGNESNCKLLTMQLVAGESNMLILNNGATIAEVVINSGTNVSCFVDLETITISGNLRNIQLLDHSEPTSLYKEILGLYDNSQDSVVTLTYKYVFSSISLAELVEQDPERDLIQRGSINYRQFLSMDTSAVKYVHIQRFYRKAQSYISGPLLNALKRESTRNRINFSGLDGKDIISKRIINNQIKLNIKITSPVVIFPSNFQSRDHFLAHLGNLEVENFLIGDSSNPVDHVKVLLNDIMLEFVSSASIHREKILSNIHIKVNVKKPIITPFTKTKQNNEFDIAKEVVNVDFSDIVFSLTHSQYQTIFDFVNGNIRDGMRDINEERKFYQSIGKLVTRRKKKDIMMKRVTSERAIDSMSSSIIITDVHVTAPNISLVILKKNGSNFAKLAVTDLRLNNKIDINECIRLHLTLGSIIASDMRSNTSNVFSNFIEFSDPTACFSLQYENDRLQFKEKVNLKLSDPKVVVIPELLLDFRHFFSDTHYFQNDTLNELLLVGTTIDETAEYETILEQNETPEEIEIKAKLELKGDFGTPRIIIPEDSEDASSRLLVLKFSSELDFNATQIGKSEKGLFKITGLTVIITHGTSSLPLLEPTNIDVVIMRLKSQEDTNGPKEERVIRVSISEGASARLSYHDVKMLYTIAEQFKQKLEMPSALSQQDITMYLQEVEDNDGKPHNAPIIAKDFKKMISEELLPQTLVNKFIIESKTMSILVVDDLTGFDIPIIRVHLSGLRFNSMIKSFSTNESNISAYLEFLVHGDCYNFKLAEWEPIIEKNKVPIHCMYQNQKGYPKHIVQVECDDIINMNITHSSLETILSTAQAWSKELKRETVSRVKKLAITFEPFSIVNKCGLAVSFKVADDFIELEQDKEVRFSFPTNTAERKNFVTLQIGSNTIKTLVNKNGIYPHSLLLQDKELGQLEHQIYIEVKDKEKRKLIIIHSGCKVRNKTDKYWQIGCHVGEKIVPLAFLAPYSSLYIPTSFVVEDGRLAIRPCKDQDDNSAETLSSEYKWTSNDSTLYSLKSFRKTPAKTILSRNKHMTIKKDHMYCILNSKSKANSKTRISIIPPLAIQNVLQEDVQFALFGSSSKDANVRIAKYSDTIKKGDTKYIYRIDMQKPKMWIQSIINGWQTKDITLIYTYGESQEETCNTFSNFFMDGRVINLRYDVFSTDNAYVKIVVYCPYLIMNYTHHDLEIVESSKENYKLGCSTTIDGTAATMFNYYSESSSMIFSKKVFLKTSHGFISNPFSIDSVGTPSELILYHESDQSKLPLKMGCFVSLAQGKYERTKIVEITPRYLLINDIHSKEKSVNIEVKQFGDESNILTIAKQESCHYYWTIDCNKLQTNEADTPLTVHFLRKKIPMICIRLKNVDEEDPLLSEWSMPFSIDTLGEIPLIIGSNYITTKIMQNNGCIQVSFTRAALPPYFIVNQTSHAISVSQVYTGENIVIASNKTIPYMVPDIKSKHSIYVTLGEKFKLGSIDIDKIKKSKFISIPQLKTSIFIRLTTYRGYTRVISFQEKDVKPNQQQLETDQDDPQSFELLQSYLFVKGIGVSIINQNQTEILYAHADNISVNCNITENNKQLLEVKVNRMGIDNQLENCTFPIMFTNANKLGLRDFLHFSLIMDTKEKEFDYIPYLSLLMQEAKIAIDFKLIHEILKMVSSLQGKKTNHEKQYIISKTTTRHNVDTHEHQHDEILSSFNVQLKSQHDRMIYFELLQLHPFKLNLSFVFNEIPNDEEQDLSIILRTLGARLSMNIDEAPIRLNALILNHPPLSSRTQLVENIKAHYTRYAISEMFSILGSFDIIGNPVGLFNDIDKGVYDLFYEPMEGITKSPKEFTLGLAKGTTSFFKHSIHGTFNTASKVTESISNGISLLTLDEDYQIKRKEANHLSKRPKHIGEGLVSGAQSLSMGLFEAGTGLFVKPIEGASKEGISGFLKGVGKGIIGMPVKPITGVLDFVYKTSEGLKNTTQYFDREFQIHRKRFPRYVGADKKLNKYDGNASFGCFAFAALMKQGIIPNDSTYVSHYFLTSTNDVVFLSTQHICQVSCLVSPPPQQQNTHHNKITKYFSSQHPPKPEQLLEKFSLTWIYEIKTISKLDCSRNNPNSIVLRVKSQTAWFGFGDLYDDVIIETEPHNNDLLSKLHQLHKF